MNKEDLLNNKDVYKIKNDSIIYNIHNSLPYTIFDKDPVVLNVALGYLYKAIILPHWNKKINILTEEEKVFLMPYIFGNQND